MTWGRGYGDPYHNENRCIRTQLYNNNIIHLSYQKHTPTHYEEYSHSVALTGRTSACFHRNSSAQQKQFNFGPLI